MRGKNDDCMYENDDKRLNCYHFLNINYDIDNKIIMDENNNLLNQKKS